MAILRAKKLSINGPGEGPRAAGRGPAAGRGWHAQHEAHGEATRRGRLGGRGERPRVERSS